MLTTTATTMAAQHNEHHGVAPGPLPALGLGTVQFGLPYGVANRRGRVPADEVSAILTRASELGVRVLDTAIAYGNAEDVLGAALGPLAERFDVVTKVPAGTTPSTVRALIAGSLSRLALRRLHGCLLHDVRTATEQPGVLAELRALRAEGVIERVGVSCYRPSELARLLDAGEQLDLVQLPFSVLDRRFEPLLPQLRAAGIAVHVRSVFLQGLLFVPESELAAHFHPYRAALAAVRSQAAELGTDLATLMLAAARLERSIDVVLVGVDALADLEANAAAFANATALADFRDRLRALAHTDEQLLLPMNWPAK